MRDYLQTVIGSSIISQLKAKEHAPHKYKVLPTEALYSDTIQHVKNFKMYISDFKE